MKKILALLLALVMIVAIGACAGNTEKKSEEKTDSSEANTEEAAVQEEAPAEDAPASGDDAKKLVMGCSADFPPFEFYDLTTADGTIAGFDVMLATEIAKDLGMELEIKDLTFDTLIGAMGAGQIDMILSGMNATEERKAQVDFSTEYFSGNQVVVVQKAQLDKLKTVEDLSTMQVGVQLGSIQEEFAEKQLVPHGATLLSVAKVPDIIMQLKIGAVAAVVLDEPIAQAFCRNNDDIAISEIHIEGDGSGIAVAMPKGKEEMLTSVNATIERLKSEGKIDQFLIEAVELAAAQEASE